MVFKLSEKSVDILSNLASIESNMMLVEGYEQSTSNATARVYATAKLPDKFGATFGMYNVNDMLTRFSLFKHAKEFFLDYNDSKKVLTIFDDLASVNIHTSDTKLIRPPNIGQSIGEDPTDIQLNLKEIDIKRMNDFMNVNGTDIIAFSKRDEDECIRIEGYDSDRLREASLKGLEDRPIWYIRLEKYEGEEFRYFARFNFKVYDGDYKVRIRQYYGDRKNRELDTKLNSNRVPAIQFDGEYIRYVINYTKESLNQESLRKINSVE